MSIERYENLIKAALEIQQLDVLKKKLLRTVALNINALELSSRYFENEKATKAISLIGDLKIEPSGHVTAKAIYKDVEIYLHCDPEKNGNEALKHILEAISNQEILKA